MFQLEGIPDTAARRSLKTPPAYALCSPGSHRIPCDPCGCRWHLAELEFTDCISPLFGRIHVCNTRKNTTPSPHRHGSLSHPFPAARAVIDHGAVETVPSRRVRLHRAPSPSWLDACPLPWSGYVLICDFRRCRAHCLARAWASVEVGPLEYGSAGITPEDVYQLACCLPSPGLTSFVAQHPSTRALHTHQHESIC